MTPTALPAPAARYLDDVAAHLSLGPRARREALADLRDLLEGGVTPAALGPAREYAAGLAESAEGPGAAETQGRLLGLPFDLRAATDPRVRARVFDTADSRLLVPRILGGGWRLNLGAVAVRLRLLRPDDLDAEVLAHVPPATASLGRAVPAALAGATGVLAAATCAAARRGDGPPRVPAHWDIRGRVDRWSAPAPVLLPLVAIGGGAAWWATRPVPDPVDQLVRAALGTMAGATTTAIAAATLAGTRGSRGQCTIALAGIAPPAAGLALLVWQVRAGLRGLAASSETRPSGRSQPNEATGVTP